MYRLTHTDSVIRIADDACIPADPANTDYQQYTQWLAEGNTPEPATAAVFNQAAALARLREVRKPILDALTGMLSRALAKGDTTTAAALVTASEGLLALPQNAALLAATDDEQFDYIAHEQYKALAAALPSAARSAFRDALL